MNALSKLVLSVALAAASTSITLAHAAEPAAGAEAAAPMSEGEVKKVDKDAGKITIRHGELKNLGMPPMTMVFRAKDPAMLDQVKGGDKVSFAADKVGGQFTVTQIEVKK
jgi:Cu/Ag efflux protein CusF